MNLYSFCVHLLGDRAQALKYISQLDGRGEYQMLINKFLAEGVKASGELGPSNIEDRALWLLVDLVGLSKAKAGEILSLSEEAARARLYRIRKTLLKDDSQGLFANEALLESRSKWLFSNLPGMDVPGRPHCFHWRSKSTVLLWAVVVLSLLGLFYSSI